MKERQRDDRDDGVSYTNMNVPGMPWYKDPKTEKSRKELAGQRLNRKEQRSIIRAGFLRALPLLLVVVLSFTVVFILMWLWIR